MPPLNVCARPVLGMGGRKVSQFIMSGFGGLVDTRINKHSSPIGMLVPPTPIRAPLLRSKPSVLPIAALPALFHQPVAISAILIFIPFVPITAFVIIITVMFFRKTDHRRKKRSAE
jgi:hypothetical protein